MRATKFLLATLLLTALAAAQSSPSSSSDKASGAQNNDPNQQPTSPLQEPVKPTEAELNKPKSAKFDMSVHGRLMSTWFGRRNLGQKLLQIGISGAHSEQEARDDLRRRLPELLSVGT